MNSILIIDDQPGMRRTLEILLRKEGYQAVSVGRAVSHPQLKVEGGGFLVNPRESGLPTMETQGKETAMQDRKGK
ncbi:MAG: hypothetical protein AB1830_06775, partial [Pseudomonadota bacterium]